MRRQRDEKKYYFELLNKASGTPWGPKLGVAGRPKGSKNRVPTLQEALLLLVSSFVAYSSPDARYPKRRLSTHPLITHPWKSTTAFKL